jgi:ketosteroid isomerase-like protein
MSTASTDSPASSGSTDEPNLAACTNQCCRDAVDEVAITAAVQRYAFAIDAFDWNALTEVFTVDAVARYHQHPPVIGNAAIASFLRERVGPSTWHQHFISITDINRDGDRAKTTSAFIAHSINPTRPGKIRLTLGSYVDVLVRTDAGWRIAERDQVTGLREVRDLGDPNG